MGRVSGFCDERGRRSPAPAVRGWPLRLGPFGDLNTPLYHDSLDREAFHGDAGGVGMSHESISHIACGRKLDSAQKESLQGNQRTGTRASSPTRRGGRRANLVISLKVERCEACAACLRLLYPGHNSPGLVEVCSASPSHPHPTPAPGDIGRILPAKATVIDQLGADRHRRDTETLGGFGLSVFREVIR